MNFLTYDEWKVENADLVKEIEAKKETCPECGGDGEVECPHCGQDMACQECSGLGTVKGDPRKLYEEQLKKDKERLEHWRGLFRAEVA